MILDILTLDKIVEFENSIVFFQDKQFYLQFSKRFLIILF